MEVVNGVPLPPITLVGPLPTLAFRPLSLMLATKLRHSENLIKSRSIQYVSLRLRNQLVSPVYQANDRLTRFSRVHFYFFSHMPRRHLQYCV